MTTDLDRCMAAPRRWRIGPYEFDHIPEAGLRSGWGCNRNGRGVGNTSSPVAAFFALRRWVRDEPEPRPCEEP